MLLDQTLIDILQHKIVQVKLLPRTAQREIEEIMFRKFNVSYSTTIDIFNGLLPLENLNDDMVYKLMVSIHDMVITNERFKSIDVSDLYPKKYFNDYQIKLFDKPLEINDEDEDMTFDNWLQVADDQYICVVPVEQVKKWHDINKIKYNEKTQRELTVKSTKGGVIIKVVTLFKTALKEIGEKMEKNEYIPDDITLNVNPDINDELPKISHGKLIIPKESQVDIIDGFHRFLKLCDTKAKNPDWNINCIINVMVFNEEKAVQYIIQKDKKNHLSEKQILKNDTSNQNHYVIKRLNESNDFHHKGNIDEETFVFLVKLVSNIFHAESMEKKAVVDLSKLISKVINIIIEDNNLYDQTLSKKEWFIYLYLLKLCDCNSDKFFNIINKLNLNSLLDNIKFINYPSKKHFDMVNTSFNEVKIKNE